MLEAHTIGDLETVECVCPGCPKALSECMEHCLQEINLQNLTRFTRIHKAIVIDKELSIERQELTPSFKLIPRNIEKHYREYIDYLKTGEGELPAKGYLLEV